MKVHISVLLLSATLILQGCVTAVLVGSAAFATKTTIDPRTIGTQLDDSTLETRITNALAKDQYLKKEARVVNTVYQGKVLLTGQASTTELAERAKQITMGVDGVTDTYNEIRQGQPVSLGRATLDTWITIQICSKLMISNVIKSSNVKVITENGEVFLLGLVNYAEGRATAKIASKVNGVKHVRIAFTYLQP